MQCIAAPRSFYPLPPPYRRADDVVQTSDLAGFFSMNVVKEVETAFSGLHDAFDPSEIKPWEPGRFEEVVKLQDAPRNQGEVLKMWDKVANMVVAVKRMPNNWIQSSHSEFIAAYPKEIEFPWQDIGCNKLLSAAGFPYGCNLLGVFRDDEHTEVVTTFATEGDLFSWCVGPLSQSVQPGPDREAFIRPLAFKLLHAVQQLHELSLVHRDISLENVLLSEADGGELLLQVIDFGMASHLRYFQECVRGKPAYQAPELHQHGVYDAFLSDAFSVGVTIYSLFVQDYPWLSTKPGACKCYAFARKHGFRGYVRKRKLRKKQTVVADRMSAELVQMLEGLLEPDPSKRLTLGESAFNGFRKSVWDEKWMRSNTDLSRVVGSSL
jgi:serine/threonine protein kinase